MHKYKIILDKVWYSNGCSCCEPDSSDIYRLEADGELLTYPVLHFDDPRYPQPMGWLYYGDVLKYILEKENVEVELVEAEEDSE